MKIKINLFRWEKFSIFTMQTQEVNSAKYFLVEVPEGTVNGGEGREQRRVRQGCGDFTYFIKVLPHRLLGT